MLTLQVGSPADGLLARGPMSVIDRHVLETPKPVNPPPNIVGVTQRY